MSSATEFPPVPEHVPEALRQTYLRSDITIKVDGETLDPPRLLERYASPVFVVTACNPLGEEVPTEDNHDRMRTLSSELNTDGVTWLPALGRDPYRDWAESSVAIFNVTCKDARAIGRRYSQLAIFELTDTSKIVHGCFSRWSTGHELAAPMPKGSELTLAEAAEAALGVGVDRDLKRFRYPGWRHLGSTELACGECTQGLELFSLVRAQKSGTIVEHLAVVCAGCGAAEPTTTFSPTVQELIERWRDYLLANDDAAQAGADGTYNCYIIQLGELDEQWVYVGETAKEPLERFGQHKNGDKSNAVVRTHGVALRTDLMAGLPTLPDRMSARTYERYLGAKLALAGLRVEGAR